MKKAVRAANRTLVIYSSLARSPIIEEFDSAIRLIQNDGVWSIEITFVRDKKSQAMQAFENITES